MPTATNKIKYGLSKCYYAIKGTEGYGTPVALPGAVSLSLAPQGELYKFYADNVAYFRVSVNNGYEGTLELAMIPEGFIKDVLGNTLDATDHVLVEEVQSAPVEFALGFQIEGDAKASRFWVYNCVATRPNMDGDTKEDSIEAQTESFTISRRNLLPLSSGNRKTQDSSIIERKNRRLLIHDGKGFFYPNSLSK